MELLIRGHKVITCGDKVAEKIYAKEFPEIKHIFLKGYKPYYSKRKSQEFMIIKQLPKFINRIIQEKKTIEKICSEENIDIIISDNRFGLRSKRTTNIYITHQINIMGSYFITKLINPIHRKPG